MYVPPKVKLCPPEISPRLEDVTYAEVRPFQVKSIILEQMAKGRVVNAVSWSGNSRVTGEK
ncbi:hypothetical protein J7E66_02585 [Bacillus sp. ISL-7]|nr:hypothetical protein [Bacillus sp. ISL-7]MBT2733652.1 hypothetical protein [Bacillus sp. ISL-7]